MQYWKLKEKFFTFLILVSCPGWMDLKALEKHGPIVCLDITQAGY